MEEAFSLTGGARIGWLNATWPLARLSASASGLKISGVLGTYEFLPRDVVSIERYGSIPLFSSGIQILHARSDYPSKIIFWYPRAEALIQEIHRTGFLPIAPASSQTSWHGIPFRWASILIFILVWNGLLLLNRLTRQGAKNQPGIFTLAALLFAFLTAWGIRGSTKLQNIVLSDGHSINEVKGFLSLLQVISGFLLAFFALLFLAL